MHQVMASGVIVRQDRLRADRLGFATVSPTKPIVVAAVQTRPSAADIQANAAEHARSIAHAAEQGARICLFPELSLTGYELDAINADPRRCTVTPDDPRLTPVQEACRDAGVHALVGAPTRTDEGLQVATLVIDPTGQVAGRYAKRYLHGPELEMFAAGDRDVVLEIDGWRLGLAICYDAAVPEHALSVRAAGADAYLVSALYGADGEDRLREQMTRAAGLGMWAVLAQFTGMTGPYDACGRSGVWRPGGEVEVQLDATTPGIAVAALGGPRG